MSARSRAKSARDLMQEFDPNDPRKGDYLWATFVPARATKFKLHLSRGPALNGCNRENWYILYQWDSSTSRWREVTRIDERRSHVICHACGRDASDAYQYGHCLRWWWVGQPFLREVGLCKTCADYHGPLYAMMKQPIDKRVLIPHPATTNAP